jgi:hypothetical protein
MLRCSWFRHSWGSEAEPATLPRERARAPERKRTRNKNIKMFGHVHVYEHEHVHVVCSKVRPQVSFASLCWGIESCTLTE